MWAGQQRPTGCSDSFDHVLSLTDRGGRYAGRSQAVRDLVRPQLLENRLSYQLLDLRADHGLELSFGTTAFFKVFDVKQFSRTSSRRHGWRRTARFRTGTRYRCEDQHGRAARVVGVQPPEHAFAVRVADSLQGGGA